MSCFEVCIHLRIVALYHLERSLAYDFLPKHLRLAPLFCSQWGVIWVAWGPLTLNSYIAACWQSASFCTYTILLILAYTQKTHSPRSLDMVQIGAGLVYGHISRTTNVAHRYGPGIMHDRPSRVTYQYKSRYRNNSTFSLFPKFALSLGNANHLGRSLICEMKKDIALMPCPPCLMRQISMSFSCHKKARLSRMAEMPVVTICGDQSTRVDGQG